MSSSLGRPSRPVGQPAQATRQQLDELDALLQRMLELPVHAGDDSGPSLGLPAAPAPHESPLANRRAAAPRAYPPSYMVVETNAPPMGGHEPADAPVPGGRHDLVSDDGEGQLLPGETGEEEWVPFRSSWQPSAQTWGPLARSWAEAQGKPPAPEPEYAPQMPPLGPPRPAPAGPVVATHPAPDDAPIPTVRPPARPMIVPPLAPASPQAPPPAPAAPEPAWRGGPLVWFNAAFDLPLTLLGPLGAWLRRPAGRNLLGAAGTLALAAAAALAAADGFGWTW